MQNEGRVMRSYSSSEQLLQQVASLKKELQECRKTKAFLQDSKLDYVPAWNNVKKPHSPPHDEVREYQQNEIKRVKPISPFAIENMWDARYERPHTKSQDDGNSDC